MSFILDALKKSEERRQKDQPQQSSRHIIALHDSQRRRWSLWLILGLLPLALFFGWWLGKTSEEPPSAREIVQRDTISERQTTANQAAPPAVNRPVPRTTTSRGISPRDSAPRVSNQNSPTESKRPVEAASASLEQIPVIPAPVPSRAQPPASAAKPQRPEASGSANPSSAATPLTASLGVPPDESLAITSYADLSRDVKNRLPRLQVSLHYYSADPNRRMVRLNDRLLHEGDLVAEGLTIEEITPSATILDYHGLLFRLDRP